MEIDATWLGAVLAKYDRDNSIVGVQSVVTESAVGAGDNYASVVVRATLQVVLGSGRITSKKVIIKKLPNLPPNVLSDLNSVFHLEGIVFNNILSGIGMCFNEYKVPYDKCWADCYIANHNVLAFEDLKESGYTLASRQKGLNMEHATLVFTTLARFHSASIVAASKGLIGPKLLPKLIILDLPSMTSFVPNALSSVADAIHKLWGSEWSDVEMEIRNLSKDPINTLKKLVCQEHKLSVVNHGDCWTSNMMFKYDKNGSPIHLKLMDFQGSHYNSYAWDLTYFFHTCLEAKYMKENYDSLIECYHKEFRENLQRLGSDPSIAPTVIEIKSELERLRPYSLAVSCAIRPISTNPSDIKVNLDELLNDREKFNLFFQVKELQETMKIILSRFKKVSI